MLKKLKKFISEKRVKKRSVNYVSRKQYVHENFKKTLKELKNWENLNLGDYELIYFKSYYNVEKKQSLVNLLQQVNNYSKNLPTVGVELEYNTLLPKDLLDYLNDGKYCWPNKVPKSENKENKTSEIRLLPTNPYAMRWLFEEINCYLPKISSTVQVCVEHVNDRKMPFIFLALYFMHPSCVLPKNFNTAKDLISFPGAYVGQTATKHDSLKHRAQSNYYVLHSYDVNEISNACFYAAKLHALNYENFINFEEDLREFLGFSRAVKIINEEVWVKESDELKKHLRRTWPRRDNNNKVPYQMPKEFIEYSIKRVKKYFKLPTIIEKVQELSKEEIIKITKLNYGIKEIIEKHISINPEDLMYKNSLEELLI